MNRSAMVIIMENVQLFERRQSLLQSIRQGDRRGRVGEEHTRADEQEQDPQHHQYRIHNAL